MVAAFPAGGPSIRLTPYGLTLPVPEVPAASEETTISPQEPAIPAPLSVVDLFKVGIGPSSSHTVGPMRAGHAFARELAALLATAATTPSSPAATSKLTHLTVDLFGSLGATGRGHNTDRAVLLGLAGHLPESVEIHEVEALLPELARTSHLSVAGVGSVPFTLADDLRFLPGTVLPFHVNGLTVTAWGSFDATSDAGGSGDARTTKAPAKGASPAPLLQRTYYSVGGGFVMVETSDSPHNPAPVPLDDSGAGNPTTANATATPAPLPYPFATGAGLLAHCSATGLSVAQVVRANEESQRSRADLEEHLDTIANTMFACVHAGIHTRGILPGGLDVPRRAAALADKLRQRAAASPPAHGLAATVPNATPIEWAATSVDPMRAMDLVNLHALAVNEENAAGHRVVTAPTNGAAGVIPAVLGYLTLFCPEGGANLGGDSGGTLAAPPAQDRNTGSAGSTSSAGSTTPSPDSDAPCRLSPSDQGTAATRRRAVHDFLLAATAIGSLIKTNASIAGAEVGCQGEVGSASAMAAAGLAQALGGTPAQVENAAEIAMEHSLGLTCDPVAGLVQIPCIERNAIAAVKAINAARMALWGDGRHAVSLDVVIETMRQTGVDMLSKYKETSAGGLAVNVVEC